MKTRVYQKGTGWIFWTVLFSFILIATVLFSIYYTKMSISHGVSIAKASLHQSYEASLSETSSGLLDRVYSFAEETHHVSNRVSIHISDVQEIGSLEVLSIGDIVYILPDGSETSSKFQSLLKVPGTGSFTVNLKMAEFLVDNERAFVRVRLPKPALGSIDIDEARTEQEEIKKGIWLFSSMREGVELAQRNMQEAQYRIQMDFEADEQYTKLAEDHARAMLITLIKSFNPDVENLQVEVEFYD